ncbi:MAG: lipid IV(A) 3-deoxy-D-manno-octulosonic acid transferase [Rhodocyclaceae bacterium]|nr:lipid IV(A) 3-deoxy-D-manno-octulosonic acid transferase [Rhodocyclaceae bacterium]
MLRLAYTLLWCLALPAALARLYWRGRREPGYRQHLAERFGRYHDTGDFTAAWWIHAVSVGETRAAEPIVQALLGRDPDARVLLTQMTPTGRRTAQALYARCGERVRIAYLPYDLPFLANRFLRHFQPRIGMLMETEVWPNLIHAAHQAGTPLALVNARMSERSARRYARLGGFARQTFSELAGVAAQTGDDARRLADLGARGPVVSGSVKFDVSVPEESRVIRDGLRDRIGERPVVLAASTREGEEMSLVTAFLAAAPAAALLVVVPRHPQRFDEVAGWLAARQIPSQRRSAPEPVAPATRVLLGDSMGEMFAYYALADVSIIGGSWQPLGGQNLLEACAVGTPSIVGPHTFNFAEISAHAIKAGATLRAADAGDAVAKALALIDDDAHRQRMGAAGLAFCAAHRGATQRTLDILDQLTGAAH